MEGPEVEGEDDEARWEAMRRAAAREQREVARRRARTGSGRKKRTG